MAGLSDLSKEERDFIISVPYRVGIWVSQVDDNTKTTLDDRVERQTLELAIKKLAAQNRKIPFAAAVMGGVESYKGMWKTWEAGTVENLVLADLQKSIQLCTEKFSAKAATQYKQAVWKVAIAVAQAFGENIDPDNELHVDRLFAWVGSFMGGPSLGKTPENMSAAEKTALKKLRAVLKG